MSPKGNALGILPARRCKYETICLALEPGTAVMLFSDGLSEATDSDKVEFGVPRLSAAFSDACNRFNDSEQIIDHVMATVQDYESEQADDQTMILIRHTKSA
jgi:serine phosphatase RsbU (regulator of sigma subunit)